VNAVEPSSGLSSYLQEVMSEYLSDVVAGGIVKFAMKRAAHSEEAMLQEGIPESLVSKLKRGIDIFVEDANKRSDCRARLDQLVGYKLMGVSAGPAKQTPEGPSVVPIDDEDDIVYARNKAKQLAEKVGFSRSDQIKIATAVSELARNIIKYARPGKIKIQVLEQPSSGIRIEAEDKGQGIKNLDEIMEGGYESKTGLGLGIVGCKRLMDNFNIRTGEYMGTTITADKYRG